MKIFDEYAIGLYGSRDPETNSLPVILWGLIYDESDAIGPPKIYYHNILRNLNSDGYTDNLFPINLAKEFLDESVINNGYEDFNRWRRRAIRRIDRHFNKKPLTEDEIENIPTEDDEVVRIKHWIINKKKQKIKSWKKAIPIESSIFVGRCTYIGEEGTIYLQVNNSVK